MACEAMQLGRTFPKRYIVRFKRQHSAAVRYHKHDSWLCPPDTLEIQARRNSVSTRASVRLSQGRLMLDEFRMWHCSLQDCTCDYSYTQYFRYVVIDDHRHILKVNTNI